MIHVAHTKDLDLLTMQEMSFNEVINKIQYTSLILILIDLQYIHIT